MQQIWHVIFFPFVSFLNLSYFPDISSKDIIHIICAYCTLEDLEFFSNFFVLQMKAVWALESVWSDRHQLAPSQVRGLIEDKTITTPGKTPKATNQTINIRPALEILAGTNTNDFGQIIPILRELEQVFAPRFIYFDKQTDDLQEIFDYATLLRPIGCVHLYILSQSLNLYYIDFEKGSREKIDVLDISKKLLASIARTAKGPTDIDVYMFKTITRGLHNPGFFETKLLEYGYDINSLVDTNLDRYRSIPFKTWLIILADIAAIILQVLTLALSIYACFFIAGEPIALGLCVSAMIVQLCLIFTSAVQLLDNVLTLKCLLSPLSSNFSDFTALDKLGIIHHRTSRVHELHEAAVTSAKASCITILWQFLASFVGLLDVSDITTLSYIGIALATVAGVSLVGRLLQVGFFVYDKRKNTPEPEPAIEDTDAFRQLQIQFKSPCGEENIPEQQSLGLT